MPPTLVVSDLELRTVSVPDLLPEVVAVVLRVERLGLHLLPVLRIARDESPVRHHPGHPVRMQHVLDDLERLAQVALPAVEVATDEHVERLGLNVLDELPHGQCLPHGLARVRDHVRRAAVHDPEPLAKHGAVAPLRVAVVAVELPLA